MLSFAKRVKEFVPEVMLTVVDIIGEEEIKNLRRLLTAWVYISESENMLINIL